MRIKLTIVTLLIFCFSCDLNKKQHQKDLSGTEYAASMVFRETPFADIRVARIISKEAAQDMMHFELKHDISGRLIEIKHLLNGKLKPYYKRFVRAPFIKIEYQDNLEIRKFYNEYGHRTLVSGSVYEVKIVSNVQGEREQLTFHDLNSNLIENDFGIAKYEWTKLSENKVVEHRYDINDELKRNRPGIGYIVTEFQYDSEELLSKMINLGEEGKQPTPDEAGVVSTKIGYDQYGQFIQWLNLDIDNNPIRGMSAIAEIQYNPSLFGGEKEAFFNDEHGKPQMTRWGAHGVIYQFDTYGNETSRSFLGTDNQPINVSGNIGEIISQWSDDGMHNISRSYYDMDKKRVEVGNNKIHEFRTKLDDDGRPVSISSHDVNGKLVIDETKGYAIENIAFDAKGRVVERKFLDPQNNLVNHETWQVARFVYSYTNQIELLNVTSFNASGEEVKPIWNPAH